MKLWFSVIVLACFMQVEGTFWDCSSFWPFTMLGFCPVHTRVVTRVGDLKSADKNTTDIGSKEQIPGNATSTGISNVKTTELPASVGITESVMTTSSSITTAKLSEDTTTSATLTAVTTEVIPSITTTQDSTTETKKTEEPKDKTEDGSEATTKVSKDETVSEEDKDETTSEVSTEATSSSSKSKTIPAKTNSAKTTVEKKAKSTVKPKDSDDDDSDDELVDGKTETATEDSESESDSEEKSEVLYEETTPKKVVAVPTKPPRKTADKSDLKKTLKISKTPTFSQSSRGVVSPLQSKPSRKQLVKSNSAAKASARAFNPVGDDSPLNNFYGSSLLSDNE